MTGSALLVFAPFREVEPSSIVHRVVPDLLDSPAVERLQLRGFGLTEVREQLSRMTAGDSTADAQATLELTGGKPLFVREITRAMADGTAHRNRRGSQLCPRAGRLTIGVHCGRAGDSGRARGGVDHLSPRQRGATRSQLPPEASCESVGTWSGAGTPSSCAPRCTALTSLFMLSMS